jgi:hypothetical protein
VTLPADLLPMFEDLKVGLRRRAARRRRARAGAATVLSTLLIAGLGISTAGRIADAGGTGAMSAATVLYGCSEGLSCWSGDVNLSKHRSYRDR